MNFYLNCPLYNFDNVFKHELCLQKFGPDKSDQAIETELHNALFIKYLIIAEIIYIQIVISINID